MSDYSLNDLSANLDKDQLKTRALELFGTFSQAFTDKQTSAAAKSGGQMIANQLAAYGSFRRIQPIIQKYLAGEALTRKESRKLYMNLTYLITALAHSATTAYRQASRLDDFNNR
jgi:hypothetical protein